MERLLLILLQPQDGCVLFSCKTGASHPTACQAQAEFRDLCELVTSRMVERPGGRGTVMLPGPPSGASAGGLQGEWAGRLGVDTTAHGALEAGPGPALSAAQGGPRTCGLWSWSPKQYLGKGGSDPEARVHANWPGTTHVHWHPWPLLPPSCQVSLALLKPAPCSDKFLCWARSRQLLT